MPGCQWTECTRTAVAQVTETVVSSVLPARLLCKPHTLLLVEVVADPLLSSTRAVTITALGADQ